VLLGAGLEVELCRVMTSEEKIREEDRKAAALAKAKETRESKKRKAAEGSDAEESE